VNFKCLLFQCFASLFAQCAIFILAKCANCVSVFSMNYSIAYLISRLEKIAADNYRDNRRAANPEIAAARAAVNAARDAR